MASIYIIKSKTSGKSYIGQTNTTAEKRWKKHLTELRRREGCRALYSAIKKYGENDFEVITLKSGDFTREELNVLEQKYIKEQKTLSPFGYNLTTGGDYNEISDETRMLKSERMMGRKVTWGDKVSIGVKKLWQDPIYREKQTKQRHQKRGKYREGIIKPLRLKIDSENIKKDFSNGMTIYKLTKKYGVSYGSIKRRI